MAMSINKQMVNEGPELYYDPNFRTTLEMHLTYLRNHPDTDYLAVEDFPAHKYEYDFYGLLNYYKVEHKYHWIVMRVNEMTSPSDFKSDISEIMIPANNAINHIVQAYRTSNKND